MLTLSRKKGSQWSVSPRQFDNDVFRSDIAIGVDTALNVALEAIDRLKVTASSHHRTFLVEVMGRDSTRLGAGAIEQIIERRFGVMVGWENGTITATCLEK